MDAMEAMGGHVQGIRKGGGMIGLPADGPLPHFGSSGYLGSGSVSTT